MADDTLYQSNLEKVRERYAGLAQLIEQAPAGQLERCETRSGEPNLCDRSVSPPLYLHSSYSAAREAQRWWADLEMADVQVLYIHGVGLGYSYDLVEPWLREDKERYAVFLEGDPRVLRCLLSTKRGSRIVADRQVLLAGFPDDVDESDEVAEGLAYYFVGLRPLITALPSYEKFKIDTFDRVRTQLMHRSAFVNFGGGEFLRHGVSFFQNFFRNLYALPGAHKASGLFGKFKGVPAIICGAGPSLNKNIDLLKTLDHRALIFAGGSSVNALTARDVMPHFGASVDPNAEQYKRMSRHSAFETPFFFKGRTYHPALKCLHGPKIYLTGNCGYPLTEWFERELGIEEARIEEGNNVVHLNMELARLMGCDPIIFVGLDLAYSGMQLYASDVVDQTKVSEEQLTAATWLNDNAFLRKDIYGEPVYTLWKWVAEANYTASYARRHPETTFLNATEGGLGIEGVQNASLADVVANHLHHEWDLRGWVHQELQGARLPDISTEILDQLCDRVKGSLERCIEQCQELTERFTKLTSALGTGKAAAIAAASQEIEACEETLSDEVAHTYILEPVGHMRAMMFERKYEQIDHISEQEQLKLRCEVHRDEIASLKETAEVNLQLLEGFQQEVEKLPRGAVHD